MAIKISELTSATTIQGTEELPIVQASETKKVTAESLTKKPLFEIDLTSANYPISQSGIYYISVGSSGLTPNEIVLPDPTTMPGTELIFFNYDQTNNASFESSYQPYLEASTSGADKYTEVIAKQAVKVISVNGYWSALNYKL
jgi:hypothetical protein